MSHKSASLHIDLFVGVTHVMSKTEARQGQQAVFVRVPYIPITGYILGE